jgi:hypothetical protein
MCFSTIKTLLLSATKVTYKHLYINWFRYFFSLLWLGFSFILALFYYIWIRILIQGLIERGPMQIQCGAGTLSEIYFYCGITAITAKMKGLNPIICTSTVYCTHSTVLSLGIRFLVFKIDLLHNYRFNLKVCERSVRGFDLKFMFKV